MSLKTENIRDYAQELGFDLFGVAQARRAAHVDEYLNWVSSGYAGSMEYMMRQQEKRIDPRRALPGSRSLIILGKSYFASEPMRASWDNPSRGRIARYAWGEDYHQYIGTLLQKLADFLMSSSIKVIDYRFYVDTGPILERDFAATANLGFIGRNTCLIAPVVGSYLFLAEILLTLELEPTKPLSNNSRRRMTCGDCRRCLDTCPTGALIAPYQLDSRRCISYLTIELKDRIPREMRTLMKNWIFGCDECQSICPYNRRVVSPRGNPYEAAPIEIYAPSLPELLLLDEEEFNRRFNGTALMRPKRRGLLRNACIALGNWASREAIPWLKLALSDHEPLIREHAAWALGRVGNNDAMDALIGAKVHESNPSILAEIELILKERNGIQNQVSSNAPSA